MRKAFTVLSLLVTALAGCMPYWVRVPPTETIYKEIAAFDPYALAGRLIILDPGHGGKYTGAVAANGLRESDANLDVALILKNMLEKAGSRVIMTRTTDADFLPAGIKPSLGRDLQERTAIANLHDADLFISLHHNASGTRKKSYNATETFYKLADIRQSREAALSIHQELARYLGIEREAFIPGNFSVLRNSLNPAVLGEAAYLSNPRTARLLKTGAFIHLEASCYYLGLLKYFSRGIPRIINLQPDRITTARGYPAITARVEDDTLGPGVDPETIELSLDGRLVVPLFDAASGFIRYGPSRVLPNGTHAVTLGIRNLAGNASRLRTASFTVNRPADRIAACPVPDTVTADSLTPVMVTVRVTDKHGLPVIDGTRVTFTPRNGRVRYRYDFTREGLARTYFYTHTPDHCQVIARAGKKTRTIAVPARKTGRAVIGGFVRNRKTRLFLPDVSVTVEGKSLGMTNRDGFFIVPQKGDTGTVRLSLAARGYQALTADITAGTGSIQIYDLQPAYDGLLMDRAVVLDPEADHEDERINLETARYLKRYLEACGARVYLTRTTATPAPPPERVAQANTTGAHLYVMIRHEYHKNPGADRISTGHYYKGSSGKRLARAIAGELHLQSGVPVGKVGPDYSYPIMQTGCTAVRISPSCISNNRERKRLDRASYIRRNAYAILCGILRFYGAGGTHNRSLKSTVRDGNGQPVADALVVLDGLTSLQTGPDGRYHFRLVEPGRHHLTVTHGTTVLTESILQVR